jgi:hypothetical protein
VSKSTITWTSDQATSSQATASFIEGWDGTPATSKLYYIPAAPVANQPLTVVAELLDGAAPQRFTFMFGATAWTTSGIPFYASGTVLPVPGRWRLAATAGKNSGCFELTVALRGARS